MIIPFRILILVDIYDLNDPFYKEIFDNDRVEMFRKACNYYQQGFTDFLIEQEIIDEDGNFKGEVEGRFTGDNPLEYYEGKLCEIECEMSTDSKDNLSHHELGFGIDLETGKRVPVEDIPSNAAQYMKQLKETL